MNNYYLTKKRMLSLLVTTFFLFFVLFCRLFYIQVIWGKNLKDKASDQWNRHLPLQAKRGEIVDCNGQSIVTSKTSFGVYVRRQSVTDYETVARTLSEHLDLDYEKTYQKVTQKGVSEVTIKKNVDMVTVERLRTFNLNGLYFAEETSRTYVYGDFLSQVLGYVSSDNYGQSGIEKDYDKYLRGIDGVLYTETDLVGKELQDGDMAYSPAVDGLTISLTIDLTIQTIVENVLQTIVHQHNPTSTSCIVLDVTNGEILAMSTKPSVDLNNLPRDDIAKLVATTKNVMITNVYEPGSTFKVLTAAASLEESKKGNPNAFDANYVFSNNSRIRMVDGSKISCWSTHANGKHANQTLSDALNNSCNPIFTDIALSLGKETMYKYLEAFGYGAPTGIDLSGEQAGILIGKNAVTRGDLARIGFGQSIAVTALQLAVATASAVNGGIVYQPHLVKEIVDTNTGAVVKRYNSTVVNRAISQQTSKTLATMLQGVVTNGSGKQAYIEGYQVGGKTGTAQKFENGKLATGKYVSSFVGFFPASAPKYLCLVIVDEPVGQNYGSIVAAPYAKMVFEQIINYKNIQPLD